MMLTASLSFTDPAGLKNSAFAYSRMPLGASVLMRMHGVSPTVSATDSYRRPRPCVVRDVPELIAAPLLVRSLEACYVWTAGSTERWARHPGAHSAWPRGLLTSSTPGADRAGNHDRF